MNKATQKITFPMDKATACRLRAGERVLLSGIIFTARDAAHKRFVELLERGARLPFDMEDQAIYYTGPCPAAPGEIIGSAGPTTSGRMDAYAPRLMDETNLRAMIGKGERSPQVIEAIKRNKCIYFAATGGAGALIAERIKKCKVVAFPELGAEAVHRLEVEDFPLVVAIDSEGNDAFVHCPAKK